MPVRMIKMAADHNYFMGLIMGGTFGAAVMKEQPEYILWAVNSWGFAVVAIIYVLKTVLFNRAITAEADSFDARQAQRIS